MCYGTNTNRVPPDLASKITVLSHSHQNNHQHRNRRTYILLRRDIICDEGVLKIERRWCGARAGAKGIAFDETVTVK